MLEDGHQGQIIYLPQSKADMSEHEERIKVALSIRTALTYFLDDAKAVGLTATAQAMLVLLCAVEKEAGLAPRSSR